MLITHLLLPLFLAITIVFTVTNQIIITKDINFVSYVEEYVDAPSGETYHINFPALNEIKEKAHKNGHNFQVDTQLNKAVLSLSSSKKKCEYILDYYYPNKRDIPLKSNKAPFFTINNNLVTPKLISNEKLRDAFCKKDDNEIVFQYRLRNYADKQP